MYQTLSASHLLIQLIASGSMSKLSKVKQRYRRAMTVKTKSLEPIQGREGEVKVKLNESQNFIQIIRF